MTDRLRLGKKPARPGAVKFALNEYLDAPLAKAPRNFGHVDQIGTDWGMLGNDKYGDCVWAGAAHETMLWNAAAGRSVPFTPRNVLTDYSAVTGFNAMDPNTDQGTDMEEAAKYRRQTGVVDMLGVRHRIAAYLSLPIRDPQTLANAAWEFGAVGLGLRFTDTAEDQFRMGKPWRFTYNANVVGGHYVPLVGRKGSYFQVVTWGTVQKATAGYLRQSVDEAIVYVTHEQLNGQGYTPEGFNIDRLANDLAALTK